MDLPTSSDGDERTWDRPWTTEEMREHKDNWSLACDVGLFRHLQKFSEDLTKRAETTQSSLDSLVEGLKESSVMIENVTNVSLALANTQFIESRVHEDDTVVKPLENPTNSVTTESTDIDMISVVSESIKQSLNVMDAKYERVEVVASSESEDETEVVAPSVILKPQNPYQNRPLPYVIGSEKWRSSMKIGLESSSSESEIGDDEEEDENTESDQEIPPPRIFNSNKRVIRSRSSTSTSSTSGSEYNDKSNTNGSRRDKIYNRSQDTLNSTSEIETPTTGLLKDNYKRGAPSFAEELAKRLGNVLPVQKPGEEVRDPEEKSINRSKNDLFGSDNETDSVFNSKSDSLLSNNGGLFDDSISKSLWKDKPAPRPPTMIPPSIDVPPPINSIETKPKSAIDDLFGDNESDDSDDIFAPKNSKFMSKSDVVESSAANKIHNISKTSGKNQEDVMTSTPETNNNIPNLFEDDEDDGNLFSPIESIKNRSPEAIRNTSRQPPGILVNQSDLLSSALGSKLFNRARNNFSDSSDNESVEAEKNTGETINVNENQSTASGGNTSESMVAGNLQRGEANNEITTDSSGISIQPTSVNSTFGTSLRVGEPQMESTRLPSEEIYRERVPSDSLFNARSRQPNNTINSINNSNNIHDQAQQQISTQNTSSYRQDGIFDSDDLFGPPPLPKTTSKSKSKVNSLFDDSDSGDDLFSNTSSGSRSQKSADQTGATQFAEKAKINTSVRSGLFDAGIDVFLNRSAPDIDIFAESGTRQHSKFEQSSSQVFSPPNKSLIKNTNIFDEEEDDEDLFAVNNKSSSMVDRNEDKSLAPSPKITEDVKKDSADDVIHSEKKETGKPHLPVSHNLFDDVDEENDDSLFSKKSPKTEALPPVEAKREKEESMTDGPAVSKQKSTGDSPVTSKIEPPKILKIQLPTPGDDFSQPPRRAVSGKIKNLMGKMGDFKILSPTDTPPVLRRGEEKSDSGEATSDRDSEDGGTMSVPKTPTSPLASKDLSSKEASLSPSVLDTETAVSFDVPAQVETLSIASKSRARIPAKRRPQSRQARQSALRHSGIDFDIIDGAGTPPGKPDSPIDDGPDVDRLTASVDGKLVKPSLLLPDDKSELSLGKESSMSVTKNTLLSPSTDEEDLFDVPPDLPEDPQKEDTLFTRAPILSPVERLNDEPVNSKKEEISEKFEEPSELSDPLRNQELDPLKDPSQLFAFVTKTPSPEIGKDLLSNEADDSLFSHLPKKKSNDSETKKALDLFEDDDNSGDLFSGPFTKSITKKLVKETKGSLFDDVNSDEDNMGDDLFASVSSKKSNNSKSEGNDFVEEAPSSSGNSPKRGHILGDDEDEDDDELFFDASEKPSDTNKEDSLFLSTSKIPKTKLKDIFGDPSNEEDDIFSTKKSDVDTGLFGDETNAHGTDVFSKKGESVKRQEISTVKKLVTRDLKKTAEKIVEDPLSMFQDE